MSVAWRITALEDRAGILAEALERAIEHRDPQVYAAAMTQDARIQAEGDALDGVATYQEGPQPGTRLYPCRGVRHVLVYTRDGGHVEMLAVLVARSNWRAPTP